MTQQAGSPSAWALGLGYGGLLPFMGLALAIGLLPPTHHALVATVLLAYSACILTFVGAIPWGLTMRDAAGPHTGLLAWGVVPSLVAWVALLLPTAWGLVLVATLLWACFAVDRVVYPRMGLRAWLPMRLRLTAVASVCCVVGAVRIAGEAI